jgi:hypothetical protein
LPAVVVTVLGVAEGATVEETAALLECEELEAEAEAVELVLLICELVEVGVADDEEVVLCCLVVVGVSVVLVVVGGGGTKVLVGVCLEVVDLGGGGGGEGEGEGAGSPPPEPSANDHSPWMTPRSSLAKNLKSPSVRSRPPKGHPGHSSIIVAVVVFPL